MAIYTREWKLNQMFKKKPQKQHSFSWLFRKYEKIPHWCQTGTVFQDLKLAVNSLFWKPMVLVHFFFPPQSAWIDSFCFLLWVLWLLSQECKTTTNNREEELLGLFTNFDLHEGAEMLTVILWESSYCSWINTYWISQGFTFSHSHGREWTKCKSKLIWKIIEQLSTKPIYLWGQKASA